MNDGLIIRDIDCRVQRKTYKVIECKGAYNYLILIQTRNDKMQLKERCLWKSYDKNWHYSIDMHKWLLAFWQHWYKIWHVYVISATWYIMRFFLFIFLFYFSFQMQIYMIYLHHMIVSKILYSINAYKTFSIISRGFELLQNDSLNINNILCFRRDRLHVRLFFLKYVFLLYVAINIFNIYLFTVWIYKYLSMNL